MTKKNNGGPAFPRPIGNNGASEFVNREVSCEAEGMSLRDYFAAHAPAEPQAWFEPTMPPYPQTPPVPADLPEAVRCRIESWCNDPCYDLVGLFGNANPELLQRVQAFDDAWSAARKEQRAHNLEYARRQLVQWPWAWADAMLAEREK